MKRSGRSFSSKCVVIRVSTTNPRYAVLTGPRHYPRACVRAHEVGDGFTPAADVAEGVNAPARLQPGDVVVIDRTRPNHYRLARTANSPLVAGVVSTRPGVVLNNADVRTARQARLALSGTVPVKVTAENGAIRPGDLLASSSSPGHAMRAGPNPRVGTVLGKSLGVLRRGTGTIRMLVMLR